MIVTKDNLKILKNLPKISGIYKITSPLGKIYIGQSIHLYRRIKSYFEPKAAKNQKNLKFSLNQYGVENHIFEIIEECDVNTLNQKERFYQDKFKDNLLNLRFIETNDKHGYCSEETKQNISKALKISKNSYLHLRKKVYQYDLEGNLVKEWISVREASRGLKIDCSAIIKAINPKYPNKTAKGFIWNYVKKQD